MIHPIVSEKGRRMGWRLQIGQRTALVTPTTIFIRTPNRRRRLSIYWLYLLRRPRFAWRHRKLIRAIKGGVTEIKP